MSSQHCGRGGALAVVRKACDAIATRAGTVTFLFTDLVGSTETLQRLGDQAAEVLRLTHFRLLREAVAAHEGLEVKNLGDGLMVAFGSALDATRCAIAMQQTVERHNRRGGEPLNVRIGVHVGEPIHDEEDYFGTPVVIAQRLCASAQGSQVVASELVSALVGARVGVTFRSLGPRSLKGISEPVPACEVAWEPAREVVPALPRLALASRSPFVGRQREVAALEKMLLETASGSGRVALVAGEPGIGKTRLMAEVAERAVAQGWLVLFGRAYESEGMPPYLPVTEALSGHIRTISDSRLGAELGDLAAEVALILPDIARRLPDLTHLPPLDPGSERYRLFETVCDYLANLARTPGACGLLLGLEDLHWADDSTLLLLEHLGRRLHDAPIALLLNYRDTELDPGRPLARTIEQFMRLPSCEQLALRRLDPAGVSWLLTGLSGSEPPPRLVELVFSETEGNPLFVQEVYRYLADEGRLFDGGGRWRADVRVGEVEIPRGVRLVIGRRLDRVSRDCHRALTFAAIIGRVFDFDLLRDVSGTTEADLLDAMDEAERAHLVTSGPHGGAAQLTFTHELIRQALAGDLSLPRRRALHVGVGQAIERRHVHRLDPHVSELALHYSFGGQADHAEKAFEYATRAAHQARDVHAHREAAGHYEMALDALARIASDDPRRCGVLIDFAEALLSTGEPARAVEAAEKAFLIAEANQESAPASHACRVARLGMIHSGLGSAPHTPMFQMWATRAQGVAAPDTLDHAWACVMLADTLIATKRRPEAWRLYQEAFNTARRHGSAELMYDIATMALGWGVSPAREEETCQLVLEALDQPKAISTETLERFGIYEGLFHLDRGDPERGWQAWQALRDLASRTQSAYLVPFAARTEMVTLLIQGELEAAVEAADRLIARADEVGGQVMGRLWSSNVVHRALVQVGRPQEALTRLDEAQRFSGLTAVHNALVAPRLVTLAALVSDESCRQEIRDLLNAHNPDATGEDWPAWILLASLEASVALADVDAVTRLSGIVAPVALRGVGLLFLGTPARLLGDAAALLGKPAEAREWYNRTIEIAGKISFRPEVALARLNLAELIAVHFPGEDGEARDHLSAAIPEFQAMKMAPSLQRAVALKQRLTARAPGTVALPDSPSELEAEALRINIDPDRQARQVAEVVESEFFRELRSQVKDLRQITSDD